MNGRRRLWTRLVLALSLVAMLVGTVLLAPREARAETYTIEVSDTKAGATYTAYKVFDVVYSGGNYAYSISSGNAFYTTVDNSGLFTLEATGTSGSYTVYSVALTNSSTTDLSSFAAALKTELDDMPTAPTAAATDSAAADDETVTLTVSDPGYYFVTTTTGSICSLDTTNPTAAVADKNSTPSIDKFVREAEHPTIGTANNGFTKQNDANIGDTVQFCIKVTIVTGAEGYVVHDTLSTGLTLDADSFTFGTSFDPDEAVDASVVPATYSSGLTIKTSGLTDGCSFEIALSNELHAAFLNEGGTTRTSRNLYIFYTATLNENAVVGTAGNPNETTLTYGTNMSLGPVYTKTYTWPLTVVKYTGDDATATANRLAGATFTLTPATVSGGTWTASGDALSFVQTTDTTAYTQVASGTTGAVSEITTTSTGTFLLSGLDSGTYLLTETEAPDGYNKLANPIKVTVSVTYDMTALTMTPSYTFETDSSSSGNSGSVSAGSTGTVNVQNNSSPLLPTTGGVGTTLLYLIGGALVAVAAGALVVRRRAS